MKHALLSRVWTSSKIWFANELHFFSQQDLYHQNKHHHISKPILDHYFQVTQGWRYIFHKKMKHLQKKCIFRIQWIQYASHVFHLPAFSALCSSSKGGISLFSFRIFLVQQSTSQKNCEKNQPSGNPQKPTYLSCCTRWLYIGRWLDAANFAETCHTWSPLPTTRLGRANVRGLRILNFLRLEALNSGKKNEILQTGNSTEGSDLTKINSWLSYLGVSATIPSSWLWPQTAPRAAESVLQWLHRWSARKGTMLKSRKSHHSAVAHLLYTSQNCTPS